MRGFIMPIALIFVGCYDMRKNIIEKNQARNKRRQVYGNIGIANIGQPSSVDAAVQAIAHLEPVRDYSILYPLDSSLTRIISRIWKNVSNVNMVDPRELMADLDQPSSTQANGVYDKKAILYPSVDDVLRKFQSILKGRGPRWYKPCSQSDIPELNDDISDCLQEGLPDIVPFRLAVWAEKFPDTLKIWNSNEYILGSIILKDGNHYSTLYMNPIDKSWFKADGPTVDRIGDKPPPHQGKEYIVIYTKKFSG
jgi:hypothetical protein